MRKRAKFRKPPRLDRPVVEVEFRALPFMVGGVSISCEVRPNELVVDARSRIPSRIGGCRGDELVDPCERWDSLRKRFIPDSANDRAPFANKVFGDGKAGTSSLCLVGLASVCLRCSAAPCGLCRPDVCKDFADRPLTDARGVSGSFLFGVCCSSGGGSFTGSGNNELRFLLRRGSRKNVVCVETVCVVVVVCP